MLRILVFGWRGVRKTAAGSGAISVSVTKPGAEMPDLPCGARCFALSKRLSTTRAGAAGGDRGDCCGQRVVVNGVSSLGTSLGGRRGCVRTQVCARLDVACEATRDASVVASSSTSGDLVAPQQGREERERPTAPSVRGASATCAAYVASGN